MEASSFYQPSAKCGHTSVLVEEQLFVWAASPDIPEVHSSEEKLRTTSYVDVFQCNVGTWEQCSTTGTPPLGVRGYAACRSGGDVFYFGGYCGHGTCYHNSMFALGTDNLAWRELFPTNDTIGPMKKGYCAMLPFHNRLLTIGGQGATPPRDSFSSATYEKRESVTYTNEHHLFDADSAEWLVPMVTGELPPPASEFSFTKVSSDQAALFGGCVGGDVSSELRLATVNLDSVHWQKVASRGPDHPTGRACHTAATPFDVSPPDLDQCLLLLLGGRPSSDSWICDVGNITWKRIVGLPDDITKRCGHSMSVVGVSGDTMWVMVVGGQVGEKTSEVVSLFELKLGSRGHWKVTSVRKNEEIYRDYAERFSHTFPALMSAHVRKLHEQKSKSRGEEELSQQLQESRQQLQLVQQQNAEKEEMVEVLQQRLAQAGSERTQLDAVLSELDKVKRLYQVQTTEKSMLEQKLERSFSSLVNVKKSRSSQDAAVQANYLSATDPASEMEVLSSTVIEITGERQQTIKWPGNGFRLTIPAGAVPKDTTISLAVRALLAKGFQLPENYKLISAIYWITASQEFLKEVTMHIQHCAIIETDAQCARFKIVAGKYNEMEERHQLKAREGGVFTPHTHEATYSINKFAFYGAVCEGTSRDTTTYYWGQAYYQQVGWTKSWMLDYVITTYVDTVLNYVQEKYESRGWSQHHEHLLEYDECSDEDAQPTVSVHITDPADEDQANWGVNIITPCEFKQSGVDQLSERAHLPFSRIGVQWRGPPGSTHHCFVRSIDLIGMRGPHNYFRIFLPDWNKPPNTTYQEGRRPAYLDDMVMAEEDVASPKKRSRDEALISASTVTSSEPLASTDSPDESCLDEDDLQTVLAEIGSVRSVRSLGLALGVQSSTVEKIQSEYSSLEQQKIQVIYRWLQRMEIIPDKHGCLPTWSELASAVAGENASLSEHIRRTYCDRLP